MYLPKKAIVETLERLEFAELFQGFLSLIHYPWGHLIATLTGKFMALKVDWQLRLYLCLPPFLYLLMSNLIYEYIPPPPVSIVHFTLFDAKKDGSWWFCVNNKAIKSV